MQKSKVVVEDMVGVLGEVDTAPKFYVDMIDKTFENENCLGGVVQLLKGLGRRFIIRGVIAGS